MIFFKGSLFCLKLNRFNVFYSIIENMGWGSLESHPTNLNEKNYLTTFCAWRKHVIYFTKTLLPLTM